MYAQIDNTGLITDKKNNIDIKNKAKNTACIEVKNISLKFGEKTLLDDVSLAFKAGELTIILGPNGTGKSSLLKVMTGEIKTKGEVLYYQQKKEKWPNEELARSLGVLPQHNQLTFGFRVQEVVELGGLTLAKPQKEISQIARQMMEYTEISQLAERLYPTLSGGEKQRVHLARVLTQLSDAPRDKIIFLDEPTSALDIRHQHNTLALAKKLTTEGAAVIIVLHDLNLASQYADNIILLNKGRVVAKGSAKNVLTSENIHQVYNWDATIMPHPKYGFPLVIT